MNKIFDELTDAETLKLNAERVGVPDHLIDGLVAYVAERRPTGDFLRAVLENDLMEAFGRADVDSALGMRHIATFLYNYVPKKCYGSPERVVAWLKQSEETA